MKIGDSTGLAFKLPLTSSTTSKRAQDVLLIVLIAIVYFLAAKFGFLLAFETKQVTAVWPPTGIAFVAYLLFGFRVWPGVLLGAFLINAISGEPIWTAFGIALGNALAGIVGLALLRHFVNFDQSLARIKDILGLVFFGAAAGCAVSATNGVAQLAIAGIVPWASYGSVWLVWWMGDTMGVLLVAPLLLAWVANPKLNLKLRNIAESGLLFFALIVICQLAISGEFIPSTSLFRLEYAVFPIIIWAALRFGQREVATVVVVISGFAIWGVIHDRGPFATGTLDERLMLLELFMAVTTVTGLTLAAAIRERRVAEVTSLKANATLEMRVRERTAELAESEQRFRGAFETAAHGMALVSTEGRWLKVNPALCAMIGYEEEELLVADFQTITHPDDLLKDLEYVHALLEGQIESYQMEKRYFHKNECLVWVLLSVSLVRNMSGEPLHFVSQIQDITQQKAAQDALEEASNQTELAKERFSIATESGGIGIWDWNIEKGTFTCDALQYRLYGLAMPDQPEPLDVWLQRVHLDDRVRLAQELTTALGGGAPYDTEFRVVWEDGSVHNMRATARVKRDANGRALHMIGANWDVTASRRLTAELAEQHTLLEVTLRSIGDAVITTDIKGQVQWLNPVAERMTGWLASEAVGRQISQVFHIFNEETREPATDPIALCLLQGKVVGLEHTLLISRDGVEYGIEDSAAPIKNDRGEMLGGVLVFHDVTEKRRLSGEMSYRATHDALTGLVNRSEFDTRLRRLLKKAQEDGSEHALLYIDLDQFKLVNDSCGHAIGDQLLQQVSKLLSSVTRDRDTLARLGGDEFAILLEHCAAVPAQRVSQQICERMDDFRFLHDGKRFRIGASIGLVPVDKRWSTTESILQAADTSCYAAKEAGRNRVHVWFDSDLAMRTRHGQMQWTDRIGNALDENKFVLFAQRIMPLNDAFDRVHAEVLLRMVDDDGSFIPPGVFLPAAERFHLVSRIDRWVLRHTIEWMKAAPSLDAIVNLSINLSGQSVGDRAFHLWAIELLNEAGPKLCRKLCFEITETSAVTNLDDAALFIEQVHAAGIRVALDDFGAGASSFGYLKSLSVDFLKIDGQFIKDLINNPLDDAAVRCFADVAQVIGVKTVAEFVEQPDVLERLRAIGVDFVQGYLMHRPEPIDALLEISSDAH